MGKGRGVAKKVGDPVGSGDRGPEAPSNGMTQIRGLIAWGGIEESARLYVSGWVWVCVCGERMEIGYVCM